MKLYRSRPRIDSEVANAIGSTAAYYTMSRQQVMAMLHCLGIAHTSVGSTALAAYTGRMDLIASGVHAVPPAEDGEVPYRYDGELDQCIAYLRRILNMQCDELGWHKPGWHAAIVFANGQFHAAAWREEPHANR